MDGSWAAGTGHPGVFSTYDPSLAIEEIKKAREQCDYLVIYVHWGIERNTEPESYQRSMGQAYIDAGADLVVGSHPHVLQPVEAYKDKTIAYSLGNFVFGSSIPSTELLKVELDGEEAEPDQVTVTGIPCTSSDGYMPYMVMPARTQFKFACGRSMMPALLEQCLIGISIPRAFSSSVK